MFGWFLEVIHGCARIWLVVRRLLGSTSNICLTRSLAKLDTVSQLPESILYWPFPILLRISSAESSGPVANGVCPASIVNSRTPRLHTSQAASYPYMTGHLDTLICDIKYYLLLKNLWRDIVGCVARGHQHTVVCPQLLCKTEVTNSDSFWGSRIICV